MKLFNVGPVEMFPSTADVRNKGFVYFRTTQYGDMVKEAMKKLSVLLGNNEELSTIYLACSGTGAMEATVENCVTKSDKCLVINGGGFGKRFCELLQYHEIPYDSVDIEWNETLSEKHLEPFENKGYTTLFVNIHETTSGQLYDKQMLADFCKRNNMYFIVDAISSFLADDYDMEKYGIDLTIISSQKGLCLSPGMAMISFSKRMKEKVENSIKIPSSYFDFKDYLKNMTRGQTPYTPTVMVMYELHDMLNLIEKKGGKTAWLKEVENKCMYCREKIHAAGLKIPEYPKSNTLTPIEFEDVNAFEVVEYLRNKYDISINPCAGSMASKIARIGHIGNISFADIDELIEKLVLTVKELKAVAV